MGNGVANAGFYADFGALTTLKKDVKANDPSALREAARQFESLFTAMMLKSMRAAKLGEGLGESQESDFYQDMYDQQLAVQMSQGKGLGLADMLVQQLTRSSAARTAAPGSGAAVPSSGAGAAAAGAGGGASIGAASNAQRFSFIQSLQPYAQQAATQLGVSADSLIAQAALETGWGQHVPAAPGGASSYNLFGIKAGAGWQGVSVNAQTTEFTQGTGVNTPQSFRAYSSVQQGVNDYVTLLRRSGSYQGALGTGDDTSAFASALQRGGYASDPEYAHKLAATAATVKALRIAAANSALKLAAAVPTTTGGESA